MTVTRGSSAALLGLFGLPFRLVDRDHRVNGRDLRLQFGHLRRQVTDSPRQFVPFCLQLV